MEGHDTAREEEPLKILGAGRSARVGGTVGYRGGRAAVEAGGGKNVGGKTGGRGESGGKVEVDAKGEGAIMGIGVDELPASSS